MAINFFQPGPATGTQSTTLSPAQQAVAELRMQLLGQLLNASAGNAPTFKSFTEGGPAARPFPGGLGALTGPTLQAMMQPGAFTTTTTGKAQGPATSGFSDLASILGLGLSVYKLLQGSNVVDQTGNVTGPTGGGGGLSGVADPTTGQPLFPTDPTGGPYGIDPNLVPGGDPSLVPSNYPTDFGGGSLGDLLSSY